MKNLILISLFAVALLLAGCSGGPQGFNGDVSIYVTDEAGNPVEGASVYAYSNYNFSNFAIDRWNSINGSISANVRTDSKGYANVQLIPGNYAFSANKDNMTGGTEAGIKNGPNTVNITVKVPTYTSSLKITVVDEAGNLIAAPIPFSGKMCQNGVCQDTPAGAQLSPNPYSTSGTGPAFDPVTYSLIFSKNGYEDGALNFVWSPGANLDLTVEMRTLGARLIKDSVVVPTIAVGSTTGVGYVEISINGGNKESYNEGESITGIDGDGPFIGRKMSIKFLQIVQTSPSPPPQYLATFELYDDQGNLVDVETVKQGSDLRLSFGKSGMERYNEGESIEKLGGAGAYAGQILSIKFEQVVQTGNQFAGTFRLYDSHGNLLGTQTVPSGTQLKDVFLAVDGSAILDTSVYVSMIAVGSTSGIGYTEVLVDRSSVPVPNYELSVGKTGSGRGTVTDASGGINCGNDCKESYDAGYNVLLVAKAENGSVFKGWIGICSGDGNCSVRMDGDKTVVAQFDTNADFNRFILTVAKTGNGTGTVKADDGGIDCGTDCAQSYAPGSVVLLRAMSGAYSQFTGWSGDCSGTGICSIKMNSDKGVKADFNGADTNNATGPIGLWHLDDYAGSSIFVDSANGSNGGCLGDACPIKTAGISGSAAREFDGANDSIKIPNNPYLQFSDRVTASAWIYPASFGNSWPNIKGILSKYQTGGANGLNMTLGQPGTKDRVYFYLNTGGMNHTLVSNPILLNNWYFVTGVYDGTKIALYVNGQPVDSQLATGNIRNNSDLLSIGSDFGNTNRSFSGTIDEVAIWNRALSDSEIAQMYSAAQVPASVQFSGVELGSSTGISDGLDSYANKFGGAKFRGTGDELHIIPFALELPISSTGNTFNFDTRTIYYTVAADNEVTFKRGNNTGVLLESGEGYVKLEGVADKKFSYGTIVNRETNRLWIMLLTSPIVAQSNADFWIVNTEVRNEGGNIIQTFTPYVPKDPDFSLDPIFTDPSTKFSGIFIVEDGAGNWKKVIVNTQNGNAQFE